MYIPFGRQYKTNVVLLGHFVASLPKAKDPTKITMLYQLASILGLVILPKALAHGGVLSIANAGNWYWVSSSSSESLFILLCQVLGMGRRIFVSTAALTDSSSFLSGNPTT